MVLTIKQGTKPVSVCFLFLFSSSLVYTIETRNCPEFTTQPLSDVIRGVLLCTGPF